MSIVVEETYISATKVPDNQRLSFTPKYFGKPYCVVGEHTVFAFMRFLCPDYTGGVWQFYSLSNGGFYMAIEDDAQMQIVVENGFDELVSADAASIIVNLFALSHLSMKYVDDEENVFADRYHALRDYAKLHPEHEAIFNAID